MSTLSDFEDRIGGAVEGMFAGVFRSPVQPAELAKALGKRMDRERSVGVGKVYAPTLYTVLISAADEEKLGAFVDTLAGELATYLVGYARDKGYELPSRPLVRFLVDPKLKLGRFEAYAELASPEELARAAAAMSSGVEDADEYEPASSAPEAPAHAFDDEPLPVIEPNDEFIGGFQPEPVADEEPDRAAPVFFDQEELEKDGLVFEEFSPSDPVGPLPAPPAAPVTGAAAARTPGIPAAPPASSAPPIPADPGVTTVLGAAPSAMSMATVTVTGIEHDVVLRGERMTVGRLSSCDITLPDANASREHSAFVSLEGGGWAIEDLGSTNGTWLNGAPVRQRMKLRDGDIVTVGVTELVYHSAGA